MGKKVITNKDFYKRFIECLKIGVSFGLEGKIVEGDIDIKEIYERIKNIKDKELKGAKLEKRDYKIIIKININVYMVKVEFKGEFKMYFSKNTEKIVICTIFGGDAFFTNSTFKKGANFDYTIFKKDAIFWFSKFGDKNTIKFRHSIFEGVAQFNNSEVGFKIYFMNVIFKEKANFKKALLNRAHFNNCIFEKEAYFIDTEFNGKVKFEKLAFESIAKFTDILFDSLSLREAIFNDIVLFKKKKENKIKTFLWQFIYFQKLFLRILNYHKQHINLDLLHILSLILFFQHYIINYLQITLSCPNQKLPNL